MNKRLSRSEVIEIKHKVHDIISVISDHLKERGENPSKEERYRAVLDAWNSINHFPISRRYLYIEIARGFDFETHETVWRIIESYKMITTGQPDRNSLAGYYRTWEKILQYTYTD